MSMEEINSVEPYLSKPREELLTWFNDNAPGLGILYKGCLKILFTDKFPGKIRFVSHGVREIGNRLPDIIAGKKIRGRVEYPQKLDSILKDWEEAGLSLDGTVPVSLINNANGEATNKVELSKEIYLKICFLLSEHKDSRVTARDAATVLFESIAPENRGFINTLRPTIDQWVDIVAWFVGMAHESLKEHIVDEKTFIEKFEVFEISLSALIRSFFKTSEVIDEILEDTNS